MTISHLPPTRPLRVLAMLALATLATLARAEPVPGQGTWQSTLSARDLDGDGTVDAYYDTATRATWLANAFVAGRAMTWDEAMAFARQYRINGIKGWRLPRLKDFNNPGCDFGFFDTDCGFNVRTTMSELAYMYYVTLGNKSYYDVAGNSAQPNYGLTNTGPFTNLQADLYWTKTEVAPYPDRSWEFDFNLGGQSWPVKTNEFHVWLVHNGDVGEPVESALR
jgi:Protein of unknown function (DUF1566)